jgi:hypothetical protein
MPRLIFSSRASLTVEELKKPIIAMRVIVAVGMIRLTCTIGK